jgi:UDP-N-acetylmuramoyl-tripeptide--D-alanyl-D-alanine ligase
MIPVTLEQVADIVGGDLVDGSDATARVDAVSIDSRTVGAGALFVPLPGANVDGHDYVADAVGRGATGYLWAADHPDPELAGGIVVDDPADALLGLGRWVRDTVDPVVVALTGSSGKTTTKDLIAAAVGGPSGAARGGYRRVVANVGSYNNELGVPLTCCRLDLDSEVLVAEVGARGIGHIAYLAPLLAPDIAVVTIVGAAHLEMLKDLDTVARAKRELVESLGPDGVAVLNADDPRVAAMAEAAPRAVTYGLSPAADWRAVDVTVDALARATFSLRTPAGTQGRRVTVPLPGAHNIGNALAALVVADLAGVDLDAAAEGLLGASVSPWRMQVSTTPGQVTVLNDAYNANPSSMAAALRTLAQVETRGRRWAALGLMGELGAGSDDAHRDVGALCVQLGLDGLIVVGADAAALGAGAEAAAGDVAVVRVADAAEAAAVLRERTSPGDVVLVKASRSVGLERVADLLAEEAAP